MAADGVKRVLVAGGGITGLTTAFRLLQRGAVEVVLAEAGARFGGALQTLRQDGLVIDGGPDAFVTQKPQAVALAKEIGLGDRLQETIPENRRVYFLRRGRLVDMPEGVVLAVPTRFWPLIKSPLFSLAGVARMGVDLFIPKRTSEEDESIASFLSRRLGGETVEILGEPLLGGIYSGDPAELSIHATFPQLVELERKHGSLVRGALAMRARAPKREGPPPSPFAALRGGMGELVAALVEKVRDAGAELALGTRLEEVARAGDALRARLSDASGERTLEVDHVVLALPTAAAARAVEGAAPEAARELRGVPNVSTAACLLAFDRADVPHALDASGVLLPRREGREASAITFMTSKWAGRAPEGVAILRVFFGGWAHPEVKALSDDDLRARARAELGAVLGVKAAPRASFVFRYNDCRPQPVVGHAARLARIRAALPPGVHVAGGPYDGVGIPDCIRQGGEVATRILDG